MLEEVICVSKRKSVLSETWQTTNIWANNIITEKENQRKINLRNKIVLVQIHIVDKNFKAAEQ